MKLRITTLSENTASLGDFLAEWGLSILIETDQTKILFDTGKGHSTVYNADTLGIDLRRIDTIVLSHGHFDHTGGLRDVLRRMRKPMDVIAHPDIWQPKHSCRKGEENGYVGIPFRRDELESLGANFILKETPVPIGDSILTTGEVPMVTAYEQIDSALVVKEEGGYRPDLVMDDRALILKTDSGLVIVLGCAHRGMINTLYHAMQLTGEDRIHAVIGGSHLVSASEEHFTQAVAALKELGSPKLGLCHCTDLKAIGRLAHEFGDQFIFNKAGTTIELF